MCVQKKFLCADSHEYIFLDGDVAFVGITEFLLKNLGTAIFVEFPEVGSFYSKKEVFATIESETATTELYMPISGKIIEINPLLSDNLDLLNRKPMAEGWLVKIEPYNYQADIDDLTDYSDYLQENNIVQKI